jgi:glycerophosphoryl diester phosphodiesterase
MRAAFATCIVSLTAIFDGHPASTQKWPLMWQTMGVDKRKPQCWLSAANVNQNTKDGYPMSARDKAAFPPISSWIAEQPIAHRGLHDKTRGRFENTLSAARAAVEQGFAIEVDLHPSSDGVPMVFHDHDLERLTGRKGSVRAHSAAELGTFGIGGTADTIPTLRQLLEVVDGKVGLVLELKGEAGGDAGFVEAVARTIAGYQGPLALMSFDHWLVADARRLVRDRPIGLTAEGKDDMHDEHSAFAAQADVDFVSYGIEDLPCRFVREFRESGRPVISWTIRTPELAARSAIHADQITFEGFDPRLLQPA